MHIGFKFELLQLYIK